MLPLHDSQQETPLTRIAVLLSGAGRTFFNLLEKQKEEMLKGFVVGVISSRERCEKNNKVWEVCEKESIPLEVIPHTIEDFHNYQAHLLDSWEVGLVCMAGYLKFWRLPERYANRVLNIHPSLLPNYGGKGFYGNRVHEAVLADGVEITGCTVHWVDNEYDHGPIILQKEVPVLPNDTPETLGTRVFQTECEVYPLAINSVVNQLST